ncbi:MAG: DUF4393 domain-containing protein [Planctomycetaceae bacterium]|jgi:hypothetical protein|nr:DUF4393 domain-containing protein [Planctomycetaceae bacterium]MBT6157096.1 DUF4393 domain-containing protein [Planctomycetaceae bacterium]MBT6484338.1 DUF4393 domain-containing protein [Planctomycetaceae bacterium]MBT6498071.1 DUF4393 domain-containing protein [Planctomycetaceae bacterium]
MARQLGTLCEQAVKTARLGLFPLQWTAALQDKLDTRLADVSLSVPEERHAEAPIWFSGAAAKNIHLLLDDTGLQALFSNLLKCAIDRDRQGKVHPAFIKIIEALSPDDARFLSLHSAIEPLKEELTSQVRNPMRELIRRRIPELDELPQAAIDASIDNLRGLSVVHSSVSNIVGLDRGSVTRVELKLNQFGRNFCEVCLPDSTDDDL